jgi:hypothetical protein
MEYFQKFTSLRNEFFTTFQDVIPGALFNSGKRSDTSTSIKLPLDRRNTSATTASFSKGLSEHVEYTRRPPSLASCAPRSKIFTWVLVNINERLVNYKNSIFFIASYKYT